MHLFLDLPDPAIKRRELPTARITRAAAIKN
jgi:hypothetical protein